jgi:hypothetical protein
LPNSTKNLLFAKKESMPQFDNCLRPAFARQLYENLCDGKSINLIGKPGSGRGRLLSDIAQLARENGILVIHLDMNEYKSSPQAFQEAVYEQLETYHSPSAQLKALPPVDTQPLYMTQVLALQAQPAKQTFVLLHNFHKVLDNPQQRFPKRFFDDLNRFKNREDVSFCCVTEESHLKSKIHTTDEQGRITETTSWLDLRVLSLSRLSRADIQAELQRQMSKIPAWQSETDKETIINGLHNHEHPLQLISILHTHYQYEDPMPGAQRLRQCLARFKEQYNSRPKTSWFSMDAWISKLKEISEIWKNFKGK